MIESNNQRLAKNTFLLYIRTFFVLFLSLYITRLILIALGERDLGIYNVVGGIVVMLSFLQSSLTITIGRFITFELGRNSSSSNMSKICSICITILIIISVFIFVTSEIVGVYMVENWTSIPQERMYASHLVFQFALLIFIIQMVRVPFDSLVIAHEKMSFYAYMSILETLLKLIVAISLLHVNCDRLILYIGSLLVIAILTFLSYYLYIKIKYKEYKLYWCWDRKVSTKILSFAGWSLLGTTTNTATQQGVNLLLNNFVGLIANTAMGFTNQVVQAVNVFVSSFTTAFNPQITKYYASCNKDSLQQLMCRASKYSFVLAYVVALPMMANMEYLLLLWLDNVPQYTVDFCRLVLVCAIIDSTTGVYNTAITASGDIKNYQFCISFSFLLDLLVSYIILANGIYPAFVFFSRIMTRGFMNMGIGLYFSSKKVSLNLKVYCKEVLLPVLLLILITVPIMVLCDVYFDNFPKLIISSIVSVIVTLSLTYVLIMSSVERSGFHIYLNIFIKKLKKHHG